MTVPLDYGALAAILLFAVLYAGTGAWWLVSWLLFPHPLPHPEGGGETSRLRLLAGVLVPQVISFVQLRGVAQTGYASAAWFLPLAVGLIAGLGLCGGLAALAWQRAGPPTRRQRLLTVAALLATGVAASMVWVQTHRTRVFEGGDGPAYDLLALNLLHGAGFTLGSEGTPLAAANPFVPTMHREPLYPAFVAFNYLLSGAQNWEVVALSQTLLMGLLAVFTYLAVRQVFGESAGIIAGLLTAASPDHGDLIRQLMTEPLFVPVFVSAVALALLAVRSGQRRHYAAAGAGFALAALVRVFTAAFFPLFLVVWLLYARRQGRTAVRGVLVAGLAFLVVLSPWVVRNTVEFGVPFVAGRYGSQFLPRGMKSDAPPEMYAKWARASLYVATNPLSELVYPIQRFQYGPQVWANEVWDLNVNDANAQYTRVQRQCETLTFSDMETCQSRLALETAVRHLPQYAVQTVFELVKLHFYPFPSTLAAYRNGLVWAALLTAGWLLAKRRLHGPGAWLTLFLGTYVALAVQVDVWERHAMPLLPLYYGFAAAGLLAVAGRLAAGRRLRDALRVPVGQAREHVITEQR